MSGCIVHGTTNLNIKQVIFSFPLVRFLFADYIGNCYSFNSLTKDPNHEKSILQPDGVNGSLRQRSWPAHRTPKPKRLVTRIGSKTKWKTLPKIITKQSKNQRDLPLTARNRKAFWTAPGRRQPRPGCLRRLMPFRSRCAKTSSNAPTRDAIKASRENKKAVKEIGRHFVTLSDKRNFKNADREFFSGFFVTAFFPIFSIHI